MKTLALTLAAAAGLFLAGTDSAQAGCGYGGYGYGGYGVGYGNYGYGGYGYGGGYGYRQPLWHDTSHYDYVPTTIIPHGNHYHVQPGGFVYHQTGHWHY